MRSPKQTRAGQQTFKLWTYAEALKSLPYVRVVLRSIREHALTTNLRRRELQRLQARVGRPTHRDYLRENQLREEAQQSFADFVEDAEELEQFGVACVDALQGEAAFPFAYNNQIAWFHHALFDTPDNLTWRLDSDDLKTRRQIVARISEQGDSAAS